MIYIRTDANEVIATGHVMRCLTIAKQLVYQGEQVTFLISDKQSATLIEQAGYVYKILDSDWNCPDNEAEIRSLRTLFEREMKMKDKPVLLMDSYRITASYMEKLKDVVKLVYIDDLYEEKYPVDMLINYSLYYTRFDYQKRYKDSQTQLLLGGAYVPLREAFCTKQSRHAVSQAQDILIICGGGDIYNVMGTILSHIIRRNLVNKYRYHVVAGAYNPNKSQLLEYAKTYESIQVHENVTDMAGLMQQCDMAVSAASTVLYECCAMQLPTVFFIVADNQKYDKECFGKDNIMQYAGDVQENTEDTVERIIDRLESVAQDMQLQEEMINQMQQLVDGHGAERIAQAIAALKNR